MFNKKTDALQNASKMTGEEVIDTYARLNLYQNLKNIL